MAERLSYKLAELCKFINGFAFKSTDYVQPSKDTIEVFRMGYINRGGGFKEDSTPVFIPNNHPKNLERYLLHEGDIVIAMTDMKNNVAILANTARIRESDRFVLNQRVGCLRVVRLDLVDSNYLYYFSNWKPHIEYLRSRANSGVQVNLSTSAIKEAKINIPPLEEQRTIGSLLGALDDKIELNRQMNETLETTARLFFKDWFVDFGPIRAKAEGRPPYLAPELWSLFPDVLDDDDKPMGWAFSTLVTMSALNPETWSRTNTPEEIDYVDLANTKWGVIENTQRHAWEKAPSRAQRILRPGDTIVGTVRPGNGSYAFIGDDGLTGSTGFAVLRPIHSRFREFVYLAATSAENIERLSHLADGAAYPAVRPDVVATTDVTLPDEKVMDSFSRLVAPLVERCEANKRESHTLAKTRDLLLPKLMSGEIRLRDAEKTVEAVA